MLYQYLDDIDGDIGCTQFPFVKWTGKTILIPITTISEQVNVIPINLDAFVMKNARNRSNARAHFQDWEGGFYKDKLVAIPL